MSKNKKVLKRVNKTKGEIVSEMQLVKDADRRRSLIKDIIFPHVVETGETIGYVKVYIQALSGLINGVFDAQRNTTTIGQIEEKIKEKMNTVFKVNDPVQKKEYDRYMSLISKMKDISVQDLLYATELPRYIDGYLLKDKEKMKIDTIKIEDILGK